mmetsp:Transcript_2281/g.9821  ORF Transcript_2281/g.9821 Transcript_2281/m.9821 type:complete len:210 (+) Transcript_2281:1040-1669(+)
MDAHAAEPLVVAVVHSVRGTGAPVRHPLVSLGLRRGGHLQPPYCHVRHRHPLDVLPPPGCSSAIPDLHGEPEEGAGRGGIPPQRVVLVQDHRGHVELLGLADPARERVLLDGEPESAGGLLLCTAWPDPGLDRDVPLAGSLDRRVDEPGQDDDGGAASRDLHVSVHRRLHSVGRVGAPVSRLHQPRALHLLRAACGGVRHRRRDVRLRG